MMMVVMVVVMMVVVMIMVVMMVVVVSGEVKLSIATGHAMQIYNCLGQLRQL